MTEATLPHGDPHTSARQDLFRHVNGAWIDSFVIPDDRAADGAFRTLHDTAEEKVRDIVTGLGSTDGTSGGPAPEPGSEAQKVADLYASFMDTARIEAAGAGPLQEDLDAIAGAHDHSQLAHLVGHLERTGGPSVIGAYVSADAKDSDTDALHLVQAGLHLPDESYYRGEDNAPIREKYLTHVAAVARLAGLDTRTGRSPEDLAALVLDLETRLAAHHWDRVTSRDAEKTYNKVDRADLTALARGFDVDAWLAGSEANHAEYLLVSQPSFLTGLGEVWAGTDLEDLKAWLSFGLVESFASLLTEEFVEENFDFHSRTLSGTPQIRDRWKRGIGLVQGLLGEAVGKLYVAQEFPESAKTAVRALVDDLLEAYRRSITDLDWMGAETKQRALAKLDRFTPKVGYPDVWREYPFEVDPRDLVGNVKRAHAAEHARQIAKIGQPVDRTEWLMTPQTVNAYYHPVLNEIVFPAAFLRPPFFDPEGSDAVNYGAIGAVIGHEIGHGFDDQGSRYDGDGNLVDWWTAEDRERFEERTRALIDQYEALVPAGLDPNHHVNGALTIGENIGDLGGLSIAWKALHIRAESEGREVTAEEGRDFFRSWAAGWRTTMREEERVRRLAIDPHSPEEFRCNQVVKNIDAFAAVFEVRPGDPMWLEPEARVTIW
ncbi:M13 family metallopeptidase [Brevibacterium litoralis]|uniref:M13 family metallopeptidase n=1 Tax=Brevibacterium litoralis TaxID=3138935 RepID=UPI0032EF746E